ncbi:MAG: hypothetical protein KGM24_13180 [Elusimicrobia bacterium]|nr:hypothetical protein [Elusimicrobiota bacterium]
MRRTFAAALSLACAAPALAAPPGPTVVSVRKSAEALRDAVAADPSPADARVRNAAFFEGLLRETPSARANPYAMDREPVSGVEGGVDAMLSTARVREETYRLTHPAPPAELSTAMDEAAFLRGADRAVVDAKGRLSGAEMGAFLYPKADPKDPGRVILSPWLKLMTTRIGEAFTYSTLVHESAHAVQRAQGRLSPVRVVDDEVEAFRVEYEWLSVMDPTGDRLIRLDSALRLYVPRHPKDLVAAKSLDYLDKLMKLRETGGQDEPLKEYVKDLGYRDGVNGGDGLAP